MDIAFPKTFKGNVLNLYQFWIFVIIVATFWTCVMISSTIINTICLDILGKLFVKNK